MKWAMSSSHSGKDPIGRSLRDGYQESMPRLVLFLAVFCCAQAAMQADAPARERGLASWYGEAHRGKLMANGQKFDPDQCTAASWQYPLGTRVRVTFEDDGQPARTIVVTITDRGPAPSYVQKGRIIDLSKAAFQSLAPIEKGLISVNVQLVKNEAE